MKILPEIIPQADSLDFWRSYDAIEKWVRETPAPDVARQIAVRDLKIAELRARIDDQMRDDVLDRDE